MNVRCAVWILSCLLIVGCAARARLEPVGADRVSRANVNGIQMEIHTDIRPERAPPSDVVPLFLTVANDTNRAMLFRYQDLTLVSASGPATHPLSPFAASDVAVRVRPRFERRGLRVAQPYGRRYLGHEVIVYEHELVLDGHDTRSDRFGYVATREMLEVALPEGLLDPGGAMSGFVYFTRRDLNVREPVTLDADLHTIARDGRVVRLASVSLPFRVTY